MPFVFCRHNLAFWGLFPFALPQAAWVRLTAPRFAPARGPASGGIGDGQTLRLLALGDSVIAGVGAERVEEALVWGTSQRIASRLGCHVHWTARGRIGEKSRTLLGRLSDGMTESSYDVVVVSVGVNDITSMTSPAEWRANVTDLLRRIVDHSPGAVIAVGGIPPLGAFPLLPQPLRCAAGQRGLAFDRELERVVGGFSQALHVPVRFAPCATKFSADGFHPSPSSYSVFARVFADRIADALLAERGAPELDDAVRCEQGALG